MRLVDTGPVLDLCTCQPCAHRDPEARSPSVTSCLHERTSPEPGLGTPGRSIVGSCSRVLSEESSLLGLPSSERFRKTERTSDSGPRSCWLGVARCLRLPAPRVGTNAVSMEGQDATCRGPRAVPDVRLHAMAQPPWPGFRHLLLMAQAECALEESRHKFQRDQI